MGMLDCHKSIYYQLIWHNIRVDCSLECIVEVLKTMTDHDLSVIAIKHLTSHKHE